MKFFADSMLGKLARWMRTIGCDVEYERSIDDGELIDRAIREDRVVLTRDTLLSRRRRLKGRCLYLESQVTSDQMRAVVERFGLDSTGFLTRCIRCNAVLVEVGKESVKEKVPPYVYSTQERFSSCPECGRVYWAGTHRDEMAKEIERMLTGC